MQRQRDVSRKRANNKPVNKGDTARNYFVKSCAIWWKYAGLVGHQNFQQALFDNFDILFS